MRRTVASAVVRRPGKLRSLPAAWTSKTRVITNHTRGNGNGTTTYPDVVRADLQPRWKYWNGSTSSSSLRRFLSSTSATKQQQQQVRPKGITARLIETPLGSLTDASQQQAINQILFHLSQNKRAGADLALRLVERLLREEMDDYSTTTTKTNDTGNTTQQNDRPCTPNHKLDKRILVDVWKACRQQSVDVEQLHKVAGLLLLPQFRTDRFLDSKVLCIMVGAMSKCHGMDSSDRALAFLDRLGELQRPLQDTTDSLNATNGNASATAAPTPTLTVIAPNSFAYNAILAGYAKHGLVRRAEDLLQRMHEMSEESNDNNNSNNNNDDDGDTIHIANAEIGPDTISYSCVMNALSKSKAHDAPERARALLERMLSSRILPDVVTWNSLLNCYANLGMAKEAEAWLDRMHVLKKKSLLLDGPNTISFNSVINAWAKSDHVEAPKHAKRLLTQMMERKQIHDELGQEQDKHEKDKEIATQNVQVKVEPNKITESSFLLCYEKNNCLQEGCKEWALITQGSQSR